MELIKVLLLSISKKLPSSESNIFDFRDYVMLSLFEIDRDEIEEARISLLEEKKINKNNRIITREDIDFDKSLYSFNEYLFSQNNN